MLITRKPRMLLDHIRRHPGGGHGSIRDVLGWDRREIHAALCRLRGHDLVTPRGALAAVLPEQLDRSELTRCARAVLRYLETHRGEWMLLSSIAHRTGFAPWSVSRALDRLQTAGVRVYYGRDLWPMDNSTWFVNELEFKRPVCALARTVGVVGQHGNRITA